jgi:1,5-anhydro-D-fructose reductase (1,5-anhydro-D-mannitol-forming)
MHTSHSFKPLPRVRWGILGCGDVTEVKSGPAFRLAARSELVAVMRRDAAKAADYARRHGVPRWYADAAQLVADPEVDAIYVATPPGAHLEGALLAARARKPAYIEKPMARNTAECDAIIDAFARAGVPVYVAYYRRCLPRFVKVQELLAAQAIGRLTRVTCSLSAPPPAVPDAANPPWRLDAANSGGGLFLDLGSHMLDLLDHLLGPLHAVTGQANRVDSPLPVENRVNMEFVTEAGVQGTGRWDFTAAQTTDGIVLEGSEGVIRFGVFGPDPVRLETSRGVEVFDPPHPAHVQQPLIQSVVDVLTGHGTCPSTGESARRTSAVMDAVLADYYGGRGDVFWTRPQTWPGRAGA